MSIIEFLTSRSMSFYLTYVCGLTAANRLYDMGRKHSMGLWVGGMIEGPIGLASVIAFSALSGFDYPADFIDSHYLIAGFSDYFDEEPYIITGGKLTPRFSRPGLGLAINYDRLCQPAATAIMLHA